jgi:hypothetical protein
MFVYVYTYVRKYIMCVQKCVCVFSSLAVVWLVPFMLNILSTQTLRSNGSVVIYIQTWRQYATRIEILKNVIQYEYTYAVAISLQINNYTMSAKHAKNAPADQESSKRPKCKAPLSTITSFAGCIRVSLGQN